jgi:hypothetical protein
LFAEKHDLEIKKMAKSHLLINEPPLQVLPSLAVAIGLNEAIVIQQVHYWLMNSKVGVVRDGFKWVFNTYDEWCENFPFWSKSTIQRIFENLESNNLIVSEQLDKAKRDMTKFYRIDYGQLDKMDNVKLTSSDDSNLESSMIPKSDDVNKESKTTTETTKDLPAFLKNAGIEWLLLSGQEVTQQMIDQAIQTKTAKDTFEKCFGFGTLPWSSNDAWTKFEKFIVKIYSKDPGFFADYVAWREGDGKYKAYSNRKIRQNPQEFIDTGYPEFEASKMYSPSKPAVDERRLEQTKQTVDEKFAGKFVPRPDSVPSPVIIKQKLQNLSRQHSEKGILNG